MLETVSVTCFLLCFGTIDDPKPTPPVSDFCHRYERQVLTQEDKNQVKGLSRPLRNRLQGNELDYLCLCRNWKNPICNSIRR